MPRNFKEIINLARQLRRAQTPSESILWETLRNRQLAGYKFYRQHPLVYDFRIRYLFFIADFYSAELRLVIELDGKIHDYQKDRDEERDEIIIARGLRVLRMKNEAVKNIESVKRSILAFS